MNQRDRIEQRRTVLREIRYELRKYAKAKRRRGDAAYGSQYDAAHRDAEHAFSQAIGMRSLASALGILDVYGSDYHLLNQRIDRLIHAPITRRPFRHLKTVNS